MIPSIKEFEHVIRDSVPGDLSGWQSERIATAVHDWLEQPRSTPPPPALDLERLERLCAEATPGRWIVSHPSANCVTIRSEYCTSDGISPSLAPELHAMLMWPAHEQNKAAEDAAVARTQANGELLVEARNALPTLLAEIRSTRALVEAATRQSDVAFRIAMTDTQQAVAGQALVSRSHYVEACRATEQAIRALAARPESGDRT